MNEIDKCIEVFHDFKTIQHKQRKRGLNDFNVFTILRGGNDEVKLHSRFIAFLLNPRSNHYQDDLFLQIFLQECGIDDGFFTDLNNCNIYTEYEKIDIYITDGNKHIIIENKIWAGDQDAQIKRYVETIKNENTDFKNEDLIVMYISLDRDKPSEDSLLDEKGNGFKVEGSSLIGIGNNKEEQYRFYNVHYNNQITKWLEKSHKEIANITNVSVGITQYKEVIEQLYGTYKEKVMNLNEYLDKKDNKQALIKTMREISKEYTAPEFRRPRRERFFKDSIEKLELKIKEHEGWEFEIVGDNPSILHNGKKHKSLFIVKHCEFSSLYFSCSFEKNGFRKTIFSIGLYIFESERTTEVCEKFTALRNSNPPKTHYMQTRSSLAYTIYHEDDIFEKIIEDGDDAAEKFVDAFMVVFNDYKQIVIDSDHIFKQKK